MDHVSLFPSCTLPFCLCCTFLVVDKEKKIEKSSEETFLSRFFPLVPIKGIFVSYQLWSSEQRVNFQSLNPCCSISVFCFVPQVFHTSAHSNENPLSNNYISNPEGERVIYSRTAFYFAINTTSFHMLYSSSGSLTLPLFSHSASPATMLSSFSQFWSSLSYFHLLILS